MRKTLALGLFALSTSVFAGTADIPNWQVDTAGYSCFRISNTSNVEAKINVHLYTQGGTEFFGGISDAIYISALGQEYSLPAMATSRFCVNKGPVNVGFGSIEAKAADGYPGKARIVAHGIYHTFSAPYVSYTIPIHNGMPF